MHLKRIYYLDKLEVMNENTIDKTIFFTNFCYFMLFNSNWQTPPSSIQENVVTFKY